MNWKPKDFVQLKVFELFLHLIEVKMVTLTLFLHLLSVKVRSWSLLFGISRLCQGLGYFLFKNHQLLAAIFCSNLFSLSF